MYKRSWLFEIASEKINNLYLKTAQKMDLPICELKWANGFRITFDNKHYYFREGCAPVNNNGVALMMGNKYIVNRMLSRRGYPVPESVAITINEFEKYKDLHLSFDEIEYPVVVKPTSGTSSGQGVVCNISSSKQLLKYLYANIERYKCISIEKFIPGLKSYRVLVLDDKVIGVTIRYPAKVTGDGNCTIQELIDLENKKREKHMIEVAMNNLGGDPENIIILEFFGLTFESVLEEGESLNLCYKCNSTSGGTMESLPTDSICKDNAKMLVDAAKELGLNLVGFDFLCEDIGLSYVTTSGYIIEANVIPDITIHEKPLAGKPVQVSADIMWYIVRKHRLSYYKYKFG